MQKPTSQNESAEPAVSLLTENVLVDPEGPQPRTFLEIVGQTDAVRRIMTLVNAARRRGETLSHTLLIGPEGCGKRTLAQVIAREIGANIRSTSGSAIERVGDLAAIFVSDLAKNDVLLVHNIGQLRNYLVNILVPALRDFELDIIVGKGPGARKMKLSVKPFTLIGTVRKHRECPPDLLSAFDVVLPLAPYSEEEMLLLTQRRAPYASLSLEPAAAALVARLADHNPGQIGTLLRHLRLVDKQPVDREAAAEILSVFGYGGTPSAGTAGTQTTHWNALSGVDFERVIVELLNSLGFTAAMTKATGDGGVDIEATLDRPIVGGRYLFQCKRFAPDALVGSAAVREFYGALVADRKAVKGVFVTTSGFTPHAREFAENLPIELIDGEQLAHLIADKAGTDPNKPESTQQP
jgi:Holliday junction DNA helicase RuvB